MGNSFLMFLSSFSNVVIPKNTKNYFSINNISGKKNRQYFFDQHVFRSTFFLRGTEFSNLTCFLFESQCLPGGSRVQRQAGTGLYGTDAGMYSITGIMQLAPDSHTVAAGGTCVSALFETKWSHQMTGNDNVLSLFPNFTQLRAAVTLCLPNRFLSF